jgi:hypothetical protein
MSDRQCLHCGFVSNAEPLTAAIDGLRACWACYGQGWKQPAGRVEALPDLLASSSQHVCLTDDGTATGNPISLDSLTWIGGGSSGWSDVPKGGDFDTEPLGTFEIAPLSSDTPMWVGGSNGRDGWVVGSGLETVWLKLPDADPIPGLKLRVYREGIEIAPRRLDVVYQKAGEGYTIHVGLKARV